MSVVSGEEVAEIQYEISAEPSPKGFYRWSQQVVSSNGKKDCSGKTTSVGASFIWFVQFDPSKQGFMVCREESLAACFGPLRRQRDLDA
jgi:hypothetical protein